jgi:hypothetical protein
MCILSDRSKRITIILPDKTASVDYCTVGKESRKEQLAAGYLANAEESLAIAVECFLLRKNHGNARPMAGGEPGKLCLDYSK